MFFHLFVLFFFLQIIKNMQELMKRVSFKASENQAALNTFLKKGTHPFTAQHLKKRNYYSAILLKIVSIQNYVASSNKHLWRSAKSTNTHKHKQNGVTKKVKKLYLKFVTELFKSFFFRTQKRQCQYKWNSSNKIECLNGKSVFFWRISFILTMTRN